MSSVGAYVVFWSLIANKQSRQSCQSVSWSRYEMCSELWIWLRDPSFIYPCQLFPSFFNLMQVLTVSVQSQSRMLTIGCERIRLIHRVQ